MTLSSFTASKTTVSRKRLAFLGIVFLVAILAVSLSWAQRRGLFAISDTSVQKYTELYFAKSADIPSRLVAGQQYTIPFAIVNHQGAPQSIRYQVKITGGSQTVLQPLQRVELAEGRRATRTVRFTPQSPLAETTVSVQLIGTKQAISFRAEL
jgi:hypothetical protein